MNTGWIIDNKPHITTSAGDQQYHGMFYPWKRRKGRRIENNLELKDLLCWGIEPDMPPIRAEASAPQIQSLGIIFLYYLSDRSIQGCFMKYADLAGNQIDQEMRWIYLVEGPGDEKNRVVLKLRVRARTAIWSCPLSLTIVPDAGPLGNVIHANEGGDPGFRTETWSGTDSVAVE